MHLAAYFLLINLLTFALYWHDKRAAVRGGWRIPEASLLLGGFLGGTPAALTAQRRFRHKTRKGSFQFKFWALTAVQAGLLFWQPPLLRALVGRIAV